MAKQRNLFDELNQGLTALAERRAGKRTLRTHTIEAETARKVVRQKRGRATRGVL